MNVLKKFVKHYKCVMESMKKMIFLIDKKLNLFLFFFRELMAEALIQCGNLIMVPKQLTRLDYDSGRRFPSFSLFLKLILSIESFDLLPSCVIQFWKPVIPLILNDNNLISIIIDKTLIFLTECYCLTATDPSIIDRQRIGWIFYLIEQPTLKLDLCSIFIRLVRILQPWFEEFLSKMVIRMADDNDGTQQVFISEEKRDLLLRTISMFANPFENLDDDQTNISALEILPRNQLYKKEMMMFNKRRREETKEID